MDLQYTLFEYLYRDASNDKSWGQLLVAGSAFPQDIDALKDCLENGSLFIAELVGIPPLSGERWTVSSGSGEDDYDFHEFVGLESRCDLELDATAFVVRILVTAHVIVVLTAQPD
jgi:hypothetical protein